MKHRRLPPLKSLTYFEAAARLRSFTIAANELNVTQGAVSRQIQQLEVFLGRKLFTRKQRQVFLTDDGHNYYVSISHILEQLIEATDLLVNPVDAGQITVVTSSALATMYLMPRIPAFKQQHPKIQIRIVARDNQHELENSSFDLGFYYCRETPKGRTCMALFDEEVFPVCSPAYRRESAHRWGKDDDDPTIFDADLIWLESQEDWINWPEWFARMQITPPLSPNRFVVNHYPMVVQAAIAGQGVALAWSRLVDIEIDKGTLERVDQRELKTGASFYLMLPNHRAEKPTTKIFREWLSNS